MNFSVVIPMYNREHTIASAIMSVLNQTLLPMEIIVVDDCSEDDSVKIVLEMCRKNRMIRLLRLKRNSGAQTARNCGIRAAKGDWILFLDSDDELVCNAMELMAEAAGKNPGYDVYYGDYYRRKHGKMRYINCRMRGREGDFLRSILYSSKVIFSNFIVRKKALEDIGFLDEAVPAYQEWDTHIRLSVNHRYFYMDKPVFVYNIYGSETISKDLKRSVKGFQYVVVNNGALFLDEMGKEGIIFYYDGMYSRCKRCKSYWQYYYWCMKQFMKYIAYYKFLGNCFLKLYGYIWKNKRHT